MKKTNQLPKGSVQTEDYDFIDATRNPQSDVIYEP